MAAPKSTIQKIKLIMNVITPDNYTAQFGKLRNYLFEGKKTADECFEENIEFTEEYKLEQSDVNNDILTTIIDNIIRKAQMENDYNIFYGQLCEELMRLEL